MSYYTGLVLLYFIFWLVVRLYRGSVDFSWWPINSHDEDTLKEEMEDYVESNRLSVLANVTPEVKSVVIALVTLGIFIFNLIKQSRRNIQFIFQNRTQVFIIFNYVF